MVYPSLLTDLRDFEYLLGRLERVAWCDVENADRENFSFEQFYLISDVARCLTEAHVRVQKLKKIKEASK